MGHGHLGCNFAGVGSGWEGGASALFVYAWVVVAVVVVVMVEGRSGLDGDGDRDRDSGCDCDCDSVGGWVLVWVCNGWGVEVVRGGAGMIGICGRREVAFGLG